MDGITDQINSSGGPVYDGDDDDDDDDDEYFKEGCECGLSGVEEML
jgi:hypothetical protein